MEATLFVIDGLFQGRFIPLLLGKTTYIRGSGHANDTELEDEGIKGDPFAIEFRQGSYVLKILTASKRMSVNDVLVNEEWVLKDGDVIRTSVSAFKVTMMKLSDAISARARQPIEEATSGPPELASAPIHKEVKNSSLRENTSGKVYPQPNIEAAENELESSYQAGSQDRATRPYRRALVDDDPLVRANALHAAVWTRQPWLLSYLRQICQQPTSEFLPFYEMLAILGKPSELPSIFRILEAEHLGPNRLSIAGTFGHPTCIEFLLPLLSDKNTQLAVAAARSLTKICGQNFDSEIREMPRFDGRTEVDHATAEELVLPDHAKAKNFMTENRNRYSKSARWRRGIDVSEGNVSQGLENLDRESRWELCLRSHFWGLQLSHPCELDRFRPASRVSRFSKTSSQSQLG